MAITPKISLGPIQYYWNKQAILDFYAEAASSKVNTIYLGETVCSKRRSMSAQDWIDLAIQLEKLGKRCVLSSLTLMESESEVSALRSMIKHSELWIEANDYAAVQIAQEFKRPFVAGSNLNIYNTHTLSFLAKQGMVRWHAPLEMSATSLSETLVAMQGDASLQQLETEIQIYGRLALSHAARCFTARAANLPKDRCETRCIAHHDGFTMQTQDKQSLFQVNGIQIQSYKRCNLIPYLNTITDMGVALVRFYAEDNNTLHIINQLHASSADHCISLQDGSLCNGYWHGNPGMAFNIDA